MANAAPIVQAIAYERDSIREHVAIERWGRSAKIQVVDWFTDDAPTESIAHRPGLLQAIAAVRARSATHLVVATADLLGDMIGRAIVERLVNRSAATLVVLDDQPKTRQLERQIEAFEQFEQAMFSTQLRAIHAQKKRKRQRIGTIPWGMRLSEDGERLVVDDAERRVLVIVRHMRIRGLKLREIVKELKLLGIRGRGGRPIGTTRVFEMIHGARKKTAEERAAPKPAHVETSARSRSRN